MKKLLTILLITIPVLAISSMAQSAPPLSVVHDETFGYCNSGGARVVCNGASGQPWRGQFPQNLRCAVGPVLGSGPNTGFAIKMCVDRNQVSYYKVAYDSNNLITSVTAVTPTTDTGDFVMNQLGGPPTTVTTPGGTGVESDLVYDPNIGASGAFVLAMEGWLVTPTPASGQTQLFIAVSETPDAINTAWNSKVLFDVALNDVTGDVTPHILADKNGLLINAANIPFDTTNLPSVIWGWGVTSRATLNSVSFTGNNNLPTWDVRVGRGFGTVAQQPSYAMLAMLDNNPSKGSSDPAFWISNCDNAEPGGGCLPSQGQNGTRNPINFTVNYWTWTSATTATFAKSYVASTISYNPAGLNVCPVSGSIGATKGGPPDMFMPNNMRPNSSNTYRTGIGVETSSKNLYVGQSPGCVSSSTPNGFYPVKINVTTPASPVLTQYALIGGGAAGNPDMTLVSTIHDVAGNVMWMYNESSPTLALNPAVSYLPAGGSSLSGPFLLNSVLTADGTIAALNGTVSHTFTKPLDFILINVGGLPVGTFQFQDNTGAPLTCNQAGTSPYTSRNNVINPTTSSAAWGCAVTGLTGVKVKATAYTSGTAVITTHEGYASSRLAGATCPSASNGSISGIINGGYQDITNPNIVFLDASVGRRNDIPRCSWYTQGVGFQPHFPTAGFTITPSPTGTVAQAGTLNFSHGPITYTDSLTDSTCAGMVHNWVSSNPVAATINASSGVLTGVTSGLTTGVTFVCNGVSSASTTVTVSAGGPTLVSIALTPGTEQLVPQNAVVSFTATCTYSSGPNDSCPGATGWASSDITCATITTAGVASGNSNLQAVCNTNITLTIGAVVSPATILRVNGYPATTVF